MFVGYSILISLALLSSFVESTENNEESRTAADDRKFTSDEHRLKQYLMKDYDADIFPTRYTYERFRVTLSMFPVTLMDLDEVKQHMTMKVLLVYQWDDYRLSWNPDDYGGIRDVRLSNELVWKPDIRLQTGIDDALMTSANRASVSIDSMGMLWLFLEKILKSHCVSDLTNFPYDQPVCKLVFASTMFNGSKLNLEFFHENDLSFGRNMYIPHHEFDLLNTTATKNINYHSCCNDSFIDLTYEIHLRRKAGYYVHFYVSPAVVMFLLMPFVFLIRPGSGNSTVLGVGVMICCIFLITGVMGPSFFNRAPTIMLYYTTIFIMMGVCLALTFIVDTIWNYSGSSSPPHLVNSLFVVRIGRVVRVRKEDFIINGLSETGDEKIDVRGEKKAQWQALALSISRVLFFTFLLINILTTVALFA